MTPKQAEAKLKELKHKRDNIRFYIKMQRRGPSSVINGKRVWPYDIIPILFHSEEEAFLYIEMRQDNLFVNDDSSGFRKGKWKSACIEKVII